MNSCKNTTIQDAHTHNQEGCSVLGSGGTDLGYCPIHWYQPTYNDTTRWNQFFLNENDHLLTLYCQDL